MISEERIAIAEQLIFSGKLSQRQIAKQTGLSRATISAIASNKRRVYKKRPRFLIEHDKKTPHVRCPECGCLVRWPCVRCLIQQQKKKYASSVQQIRETEFSVNLSGDEAKRYEEVKRWREQQSNPHFTEIPEDWPWKGG